MLIKRRSMITGKSHIMDLDVTQEQIRNYYGGALLQDAFPNLPPEEREFIKTGITPAEWKQHIA